MKCTPFPGADACAGALPLGGELSCDPADAQNYPFEDRADLLRVVQFVVVKSDPRRAKSMVVDRLKKAGPPIFANPPDFTAPDTSEYVGVDLSLQRVKRVVAEMLFQRAGKMN